MILDYEYFIKRYGDTRLGRYFARRDAAYSASR